jgi:glycine oxidase
MEREAPPASASVVVVGGGIVGLSLAFELARRRVEVVVLERAHVGAGAAGVAAGMLAPAAEAEHEDYSLAELVRESQRRYPEFVRAVEAAAGRSCDYRRDGTLLAALHRDDEAELARLAAFQERLGLSCTWIPAEAARELEPQLSPRITGALHAPDDHQINPQATLAALERAIAGLGGRVVTAAWVTGFETRAGRLHQVVGQRVVPAPQSGGPQHPEAAVPFTVRCEAAVLAAGAWSSQDVDWPGAPLGVRPVKGQLLHLRGPELLQRVVRSPQVYLVPRRDGELVVGATMEEMGFDSTPTAGAVMDLLWQARLLVPAIYDLALTQVKVGFRPATRDHLPLIGPTEVEGLYAATGHFRHGVLLAPATAALLADVLTGGAASPLLAPFSPARRAARAPRAAGAVGAAGAAGGAA